MNRRIISVFLLILYFVAWLKPVYPILDYLIHKQYIATVLCEKKDIPDNTCHGKCHLKKQLKAQSPIEDNTRPDVPKINLEDYPVFTLQRTQPVKHQSQDKLLTCKTGISYSFLYSQTIFHPPKLNFTS